MYENNIKLNFKIKIIIFNITKPIFETKSKNDEERMKGLERIEELIEDPETLEHWMEIGLGEWIIEELKEYLEKEEEKEFYLGGKRKDSEIITLMRICRQLLRKGFLNKETEEIEKIMERLEENENEEIDETKVLISHSIEKIKTGEIKANEIIKERNDGNAIIGLRNKVGLKEKKINVNGLNKRIIK